ncbi:unnamed protein product [Cochlearia groenlandica]
METTPPFLQRLEDSQSSLMDRFERLSFEAHLNNALLGRSRSESGFSLMYNAVLDDIDHTPKPTVPCRARQGLDFLYPRASPPPSDTTLVVATTKPRLEKPQKRDCLLIVTKDETCASSLSMRICENTISKWRFDTQTWKKNKKPFWIEDNTSCVL